MMSSRNEINQSFFCRFPHQEEDNSWIELYYRVKLSWDVGKCFHFTLWLFLATAGCLGDESDLSITSMMEYWEYSSRAFSNMKIQLQAINKRRWRDVLKRKLSLFVCSRFVRNVNLFRRNSSKEQVLDNISFGGLLVAPLTSSEREIVAIETKCLVHL